MPTHRNQNGRRGNGPYKFTAKRKAQLKRAQAISARKRQRNRNIATGVIAGATLAGIGATAVFGYQNRSHITATSAKWKAAVQPGSKERVRLANALSGNLVKVPTTKKPATKGAKTMTRTELGKVDPNDPSQFHPNDRTSVATRNDAFPKRGADARIVAEKAARADIPYNIDKFLPPGVKGLIFGKRVTGAAGGRAAAAFAENARAQGMEISESEILHDMIKEGTVKGVYAGRRRRGKGKTKSGVTPPVIPKSGRVGKTRQVAPKPTVESKAFDQWIADFEP